MNNESEKKRKEKALYKNQSQQNLGWFDMTDDKQFWKLEMVIGGGPYYPCILWPAWLSKPLSRKSLICNNDNRGHCELSVTLGFQRSKGLY